MLYAILNNNGEVELVERDKVNTLATFDKLLEEASCGIMDFVEVMVVKDGIVFWDESEVEMDFLEFEKIRC